MLNTLKQEYINKEAVVIFLENYYIDTSYYLNEFAEFYLEENNLDIFYIDRLNPREMVEYIDIERLYIDEKDIIDDITKDYIF